MIELQDCRLQEEANKTMWDSSLKFNTLLFEIVISAIGFILYGGLAFFYLSTSFQYWPVLYVGVFFTFSMLVSSFILMASGGCTISTSIISLGLSITLGIIIILAIVVNSTCTISSQTNTTGARSTSGGGGGGSGIMVTQNIVNQPSSLNPPRI